MGTSTKYLFWESFSRKMWSEKFVSETEWASKSRLATIFFTLCTVLASNRASLVLVSLLQITARLVFYQKAALLTPPLLGARFEVLWGNLPCRLSR